MSDKQIDLNKVKVEVDPSKLKPEDKKLIEGIAAEEEAEKTAQEALEKEKREEEIKEEEKLKIEGGAENAEAEDSEEGKESKEKGEGRPIKAIPIAKFQRLKDTWRQKEEGLQKQIDDLKVIASKGNATSEDIDEILIDFPDVNRDFLEKLVSVAEKRAEKKATLPEDIQRKLTLLEKAETEKMQDKKFDEEFALLKEECPDEKLDRDKLYGLAFTEGYHTKSLYELHFRHLKPKQTEKKISAEAGRGAKGGEVYDFEDPNFFDKWGEDEKAWKGYSEYWQKKSPSTLQVIK